MKKKFNDETWIFVIIQNPGGNEQFFGLHDEESDVSYIPAFENKDAAQTCLINLPTQKGTKYEIQAIMHGDLTRDAFANNFLIFVLDEDAKIIKKIFPDEPHATVH